MTDTTTSRRDAGLTLIEVAIALAILSVILLGLFGAMAQAIKTDAMAREMEAASRELFSQIDLVTSDPDFDAMAGLERGFEVEYGSGAAQADGTLAIARLSPPGQTANRHPDIGATGVDESTLPGRLTATLISADLLEVTAVVRWRGSNGVDQVMASVGRRAR